MIRKGKMRYPFGKYYMVPLGKYLAKILKNTPLTPNKVTFLRTIMGLAISALIYYGGFINLLIFAILVQLFHSVDITDGELAKLKKMKTKFGEWIDGVTDKLVIDTWMLTIAVTLFLKSDNPILLIAAAFYFLGKHLFIFSSLRSDVCFGDHTKDKLKTKIKVNPISQFLLFFIEWDVQLHFLSVTAILNRLDIFLFFYAIYFNLIWISYIFFYSFKYIKNKL